MWMIIILALAFRMLREIEDLLARGKWVNKSLLKLRKGEPKNRGDTAKWAWPLEPYEPKWYHFGFYPNHKERFPFSSTFFVWLTDEEHIIQFAQTVFLLLIAALLGGFWYVALGLILGQMIKEWLKLD